MTIVFTSVTPHMICMTADRAVTKIVNQQFREYDTGPKLFPFPGIGCVTTWGARAHSAAWARASASEAGFMAS